MIMKTFYPFLIILLIANLAIAQENGGPYTTDNNTVLLMHFDGDATNSAAVGNNGIAHGTGVSYETGVHGQALRLDNTNSDKQSWIEVPFYDELNFTEEFSIECWFKINSWGENHTKFPFLLRKGENWPADYELLFDSQSNAFTSNLNCIDDAYGRGADVRTSGIIETQKWYHIAVYFNYAHNHFYMILRDENFKEIYASHRYTYTQAFNSNDKLFIGFGNYGESYFDGCIDEIRISNKYRKYRDDIVSEINTSELKDSVPPLLKDKWQVYQWPLSEHFPVSSETGYRHKGNSCGITAILRLIHYWEHPRFPMGSIDFIESGFNWKADFDNTQYLFDEMLNVFPPGTTPEEYASAATLSAHIGAAAHLPGTWIGSGGAAIQTILKNYFIYNQKLTFIYREEYTKQEWEKIFKNELSNGRPILIEGTAERFDDGNWAGHFYICDGYSSDNKFHSDMSMGVGQWYDIDNFDYGQNQCALIFAEPVWGNKELELVSPSKNKTYIAGSQIEIQWTSKNISNLILEYTNDNGKNWHVILEEVDASSGTYTWSIPEEISKTYKVRISDLENLNVYRKTNQFEVYNKKSFAIEYPKLNTKFKKGTCQPVYWNSTGISAIKLEYSIDGQNWILVSDSVSSKDGHTFINLPELLTDNIVLKATDINEPEQTFTSEKFSLIAEQFWGGPYEVDDNTLLLMHFENTTRNEVNNQLIPNELNPVGIYEENYSKNLGKAFRIYNPDQFTGDAFRIKNSENIDLGNNWTMEAWVKVASIMGERTVASLIFNKWDVFAISAGWQYFGGFVNFENGTNVEFGCPQKYTLNKWYHVAMVSDATKQTVSFYVHDKNAQVVYHDEKPFPEGSDGMVLKKEFINDGNDKNLLKIGGLGHASNFELDGYLDEVRITKSSKLMDYIETVELPYFDDFEENISDDASFTKWTTQNLEGWHYWHIITGQGVNYSQCMRFENNDIDQNDWLITKALNCSGANQLKINFDVLYNGNGTKPQLFYKSLNKDENSTTGWIELNYSLGTEENKWYSINEITINNPGDIIYFAFNSTQKANEGIYFLLDNFSVKVVTTSSKKIAKPEIDFKVYPNPITNQSVISFQTQTSGKVNLSVFDIHGRKISSMVDKTLPAGSYNYPLEKNLPSDGIYFLRLKTQEGISTQKIIYKNE
jgi:hypothetical protein